MFYLQALIQTVKPGKSLVVMKDICCALHKQGIAQKEGGRAGAGGGAMPWYVDFANGENERELFSILYIAYFIGK